MLGDKFKRRLLSRIEVCDQTGCWNWTASKTQRGYGQFWNGVTMRSSHRVSYELHRGPIAEGMHVLHRCDNPACINPDHLFLGTNADNMADRDAKGRGARGQRYKFTKLTPEDVLAIRAAEGTEGPARHAIAAKYGISNKYIRKIWDRKSWRYI